jgi:Transposase DDE domain
MSRRLRTTEVQRLLYDIERPLCSTATWTCLHWIDGKPLVVGTHSKDPDAAWGRAGRGFAKGYKMHAFYGAVPIPDAWETAALNVSEPEVAARLISLVKGGGYVLGDKAFDSNPLHETARAHGFQLVAERKRPWGKLGHRLHSRGRLRSMELLSTAFGRGLYSRRDDVERKFGWLTNHGAGLAPLPNWVRRFHRVRLWIQAKLIIHAIYVNLTERPPPIAVA